MAALPLTGDIVAHALAQAAIGAALLVLLSLPLYYRALSKVHSGLATKDGLPKVPGLCLSALLFLLVAWWILALWDAALDPETEYDDDIDA